LTRARECPMLVLRRYWRKIGGDMKYRVVTRVSEDVRRWLEAKAEREERDMAGMLRKIVADAMKRETGGEDE